ncbi:helix-turn-helix transcriptional regulator [Micromonospora sp. NBC_01796]|uniref:helix-turn-helix transcriptional regulator n=1 Tax=Micromonospora sp. NBC_01796 TaxID=2975987 RepID=UPI002DDA5BCF|nr:hypothetical protein [Micromonospora sp. NBC_01796]WSA85545.1 hypothetical protein OIE47_35220 [Micromonospora sp. NBC_01796]
MAEVPGPLVGPYEIQQMLGVGRTRFKQIALRPSFPEPFQRLHGMQVWLRADIEAWIAEYRPQQAASEDDE